MSAAQPASDLPAAGGEADPLLGRVLNDRYRIIEPIGQGGMGRVYKALQAPLDRVVALKVLGAGHDSEPNFYKRFFLEASVTAKLTHPNTITLYDYGRTDDGIFFIAMEYLAGRTLSQVMRSEGALVQERVIHIAQQICRSLREAHAMGIIHRDLKPANVIVLLQHDDQDFVKVLDFGLSKFFDGEQPGGDITNAGTFMGSPHYIAPEQARNQNPDQRCDIYSLGVMLYQMLTGRVPFTGAAPVDIILKHLHEAPVPPGELRPDLHIPADLQEIVLKCMSKAREGRFQSMDELLVHLKAARARLTGMAIPNSNPGLHEAGPVGVTHTPPTPQPTLRTAPTGAQVAASTPEKGNGAIARPPPPPPDAMEEDEPAPPRTPQPPAAERVSAPRKRKMSRMMRMVVPPALIVLAGIIAAVIVLRSPIEAPVLPAASAAVVQASDVVPSHPATAVVPASPPTATVSAREPAPAATTLVILTSAPAGAEVRDARNRLLGMTPFQVRIQSGKPLELALRHRGYRPVWLSRKVDGEKMSLHVTMRDAKVRASDAMSAKRSVGYKEDPY